NFDHTGLNLKTMKPVEQGRIEPEGAAGIAWLEYMAWLKFKNPRFLTAADWAIRSLEGKPSDQSPLYEVLLPYGALVAARMNAEHQSSYAWAKAHDGKSVIAYEGIRKWKRGSAMARADYRTVRGKIVRGSFASTHFRGEAPPELEVFEEALSGNGAPFEHIWE